MNFRQIGNRLLIACFLTTAVWAQSQGQDFHWTGKLSAEQVVEIKNISGPIEAQAGTGDEVEVSAEKSGPKADQVQIKVVPNKDGVTICAIYPLSAFGGSIDSCEPGSHTRSNHNVNTRDTKVRFMVRMPRNLRFSAENVNGDINAEDIGRFVRAANVNGSIRVSTDSWAEVATVNGSIQARMGTARWDGKLKINTVNGSVRVQLPDDLNADIKFSSVNGRISSEFPITITNGFGGHTASGTVGSGGRALEIETVNGSIELKKSGSI